MTARPDFRAPFSAWLQDGVRFAPFPEAGANEEARERAALDHVVRIMEEAERGAAPVGAVIVEPVQGRGGLVVPTGGFLRGLRDLCDGERCLLIFDEIYCGLGRTGRWFACEHWGVTPDVLLVGKALTGSLPLSAAIGTPAAMAAWPPSSGEAIHTSTFLGNPVACAAALAQLSQIEERGLVARSAALGRVIRARVAEWRGRDPGMESCGLGLLQGIRRRDARGAAQPMLGVARELMKRAVLALAEGEHAEVLAITPPAVITDAQLDLALDAVEAALGI